MVEEVIKLFLEITKIPHCSGDTVAMKNHIMQIGNGNGYRVECDDAGNIMAYAKKSRLTLQSHYDMVCIGSAPKIETVIENGWMSAKGSSLGADNGMGVAMMLYLMKKKMEVDFLFTNDEEIGLIGANHLELPIRTPYLLNLDSEELGKVYIGCAGGEDIHVQKRISMAFPQKGGKWFKLRSTAPGGHSGVNIADGIPNAVTELCGVIYDTPSMMLHSLSGGERINAIPAHAEAVVWMPEEETLHLEHPDIDVEALPSAERKLMKDGRALVSAVFGFAHGVRAWNRDLDLPQSSINLAEVSAKGGKVKISLSARAMANEDLHRLVVQTRAGWEALNFTTATEGKYPAWRPVVNDFSEKVLKHYRKIVPDAEYAAIHAGLECALFAKKFPELKITSVGPTILDPHSERERVDLSSVEKIVDLVMALVDDLSSI
ncbi:M20/M25/M40 family metallo-hydrolase [Hydrogenimonas cancrithermarum]|uniref:Peptidase n=1 Tax=Hydrogenimonas cancrithermarum TaxID=2993563 RepID=A0ABM8FMZ8_9BACT|nr:M20/M25/M40 family metallo-hydrolase [Hydrogenimonas cancrithermarum]BDY13772.1 peptidase [Hydrogenimonas cancrithermarum]